MKPLLSVVDSVLEPYVTGVARPLAKGESFCALTALMAALLRRLCCRLSASRRDAIAIAGVCGKGRAGRKSGGWGGGRSVDGQVGRFDGSTVRRAPVLAGGCEFRFVAWSELAALSGLTSLTCRCQPRNMQLLCRNTTCIASGNPQLHSQQAAFHIILLLLCSHSICAPANHSPSIISVQPQTSDA